MHVSTGFNLGFLGQTFFSPIVKWKPFAATTTCSPFPSSFQYHVCLVRNSWEILSWAPVVVTCITHHTTIWQTPKKKLILCHVTSDMPVTQVTPGKPRKFKIQVQSSKSCVAVWGLILCYFQQCHAIIVGGEAAATTRHNAFGNPSRLDRPDLHTQMDFWWRNLSAFTLQTSTSVSQVGQNTTFRWFSNA